MSGRILGWITVAFSFSFGYELQLLRLLGEQSLYLYQFLHFSETQYT